MRPKIHQFCSKSLFTGLSNIPMFVKFLESIHMKHMKQYSHNTTLIYNTLTVACWQSQCIPQEAAVSSNLHHMHSLYHDQYHPHEWWRHLVSCQCHQERHLEYLYVPRKSSRVH